MNKPINFHPFYSLLSSRNVSIAVLAVFFGIMPASAKDYLATRYGVIADGTTLNTSALQTLIDKVSDSGGGCIVFTPGSYLTGQLAIKSGVELHLQDGAVLLGSTSPYDYYLVSSDNDANVERKDASHLALISANGARNIAFTGRGTIDGQGTQLALTADSLHHTGEYVDAHYNTRRQRPSELMRPTLFYIANCTDVRIDSLHLQNSANWGLSFNHSRRISLTNLDILNRAYWNNDGIDITDCQQVCVEHCRVNAADDGICLKSYDAASCCDSILISDCEVRSSASAIKTGTASYGGFKHLRISNIRVFDTFRSAIALETVDGGDIDDVEVENITAMNTGNPLFIRLGHRDGARPGTLRNVHIKNLTCQVPFGRPDIDYDLRGPEVNYFHNIHPVVISGIPDHKIENVVLENLNLVFPGRATKQMAYMPLWRLEDIPEAVKEYPEFTMFGELPSWGIFARHISGLTLKNVQLTLTAADYRPDIVMVDVDNVTTE